MSRVLNRHEITLPDFELGFVAKLRRLWPVIAPMAVAIAFIVARGYVGPRGFLYEGALTMLALISYVSAAVLLVTNLFVKEKVLSRLGTLTVAIGVCFNFSGWMIRWIEAGEAEGWKKGINGIWRYFPLDNLYPLTLGFCFGAAITTLLIIRNSKNEFVGALSMPVVTHAAANPRQLLEADSRFNRDHRLWRVPGEFRVGVRLSAEGRGSIRGHSDCRHPVWTPDIRYDRRI